MVQSGLLMRYILDARIRPKLCGQLGYGEAHERPSPFLFKNSWFFCEFFFRVCYCLCLLFVVIFFITPVVGGGGDFPSPSLLPYTPSTPPLFLVQISPRQ